jgi:hypothetical protein
VNKYSTEENISNQVRIRRQLRTLHDRVLRNINRCQIPSVVMIVESGRLLWAENISWIGETRNAYRILAAKPLGKQRRRVEDDTQMCAWSTPGGRDRLRITSSSGLFPLAVV